MRIDEFIQRAEQAFEDLESNEVKRVVEMAELTEVQIRRLAPFLEGMSPKEIARREARSRTSVASSISSATSKLAIARKDYEQRKANGLEQ